MMAESSTDVVAAPITIELKNSSVTIGRASTRDSERAAKSSNLFLKNSHLSKTHARIFVSGGQAFIEDTSSTFGTIWNNQLLIPRKQVALSVGDWVGFVLNRPSASIQTLVEKSSHLKMIPLLSFLNPRVQVKFRITDLDFDGQTLSLVPLSGFESIGEREHSPESANVTLHNSSEAESEEDSDYVVDSDEPPEEVHFVKELSHRSQTEGDDVEVIEPECYTIDTATGAMSGELCFCKEYEMGDEEEYEVTYLKDCDNCLQRLKEGKGKKLVEINEIIDDYSGSESDVSEESAGSDSESDLESDDDSSILDYSNSVLAEAIGEAASADSSFLAGLLQGQCCSEEVDDDDEDYSYIPEGSNDNGQEEAASSEEISEDEEQLEVEEIYEDEDFHEGEEQLEDEEKLEDEETPEFPVRFRNQLPFCIRWEASPPGSAEKAFDDAVDAGVERTSRKRKLDDDDVEEIPEEDYTVKRRRRTRFQTFVREAGKGLVYVVGTLAALVAYGGYLENRG